MPIVPTDPLEIRVQQAVESVVVDHALTALPVPPFGAERVYRRSMLQYTERDGCPALIIFPSVGLSPTRKKLLNGQQVDQTFPVTIALFAAANLVPTTADPKSPVGTPVEWRTLLRDRLTGLFEGRPKAEWNWPTDINYLIPSPEAFLDLSAYESAGYWACSISFRVRCRTNL